MSRASRARRIAAAAAFGGGGIGALGAAAYGVLVTEVKMARKLIGQPFGNAGHACNTLRSRFRLIFVGIALDKSG